MNAARQPRETQADDFRPINDQGRDTFRWSDPLLLAFTFIFQPLIIGVYMLCKLSIVADADPRIAKLPKSCLQFVVGCGLRMPLASGVPFRLNGQFGTSVPGQLSVIYTNPCP